MSTHSADVAATDPGAKSPHEIENEVEQSRREVERTLDAIQERLSPGQLLDQAASYFRGNGGEFARNFGNAIKHNPIPLALVGVGLAWMMWSEQRPRSADAPSSDWDDDPELGYGYHDRYAGFADEAAGTEAWPYAGYGPRGETEPEAGLEEEAGAGWRGRIAETSGSARAKAEDLAEGVRASVAGAAEGARERMADAAEGARERVAGARDEVRNRAAAARVRARRYGQRARRGALDMLHEQPLVLGAIGLAVGAAIGAALPPSEPEDRLMGETRDRLKRRAEAIGREQAAKAGAAAQAAYEAAKDEAEAQGLTPEHGKSAAASAKDKVERVVDATTGAARAEAERQGLGRSDDKSDETKPAGPNRTV